jgi:hypothetical protein
MFLPYDLLNIITNELDIKTARLINKQLTLYHKPRYFNQLKRVTFEEIDQYQIYHMICFGNGETHEFHITNLFSPINISCYDEDVRVFISNRFTPNNKSKFTNIDYISLLNIYKKRSDEEETLQFYKNRLLKSLSSYFMNIYRGAYFLIKMYTWLYCHHYLILQSTEIICVSKYFNQINKIKFNEGNRIYYQRETKKLYDELVTYIQNF